MSDPREIIKSRFPNKNIVIVGDVVADQFLRGTISRNSREAPVYVLRHEETETRAGGAANAAVNVAALGGKVTLIGLIGNDENGLKLIRELDNFSVNRQLLVTDENLLTTTKIRVLAVQNYAPRQQMLRIDYENKTAISRETQEKLKRNLFAAATDADAIIISDYNYDVANAEIFAVARRAALDKNIPLLIDSRFRLGEFSGATTATPNQEEVEQILGKDFTERDCIRLREKLNLEALLVTRGSRGMLLVEKNQPPLAIAAVGASEPIDVTGAGDTVIAVYALGLAANLSFAESARLANRAGGLVVMKKGTAAVGADEILASLDAENQTSAAKFKS